MKTILINCNDCFALYKFRLDLLKELRKKYKLIIIAKWDEYLEKLQNEGFQIINNHLTTTNNPFKELKLIYFYYKILKKYQVDINTMIGIILIC